ncbi:MAG: hypothetical protein AAF415_12095 [Pseudomonadota bacterium]
MAFDPDTAKGRYKGYVGFISPPASFDCSPQQFLDIAASPLGILQHVPLIGDFEYGDIDDGAADLAAVERGAKALAPCGVEVIAQVGGYWALSFTPTYEAAVAQSERLTKIAGIPVILAWQATINALRHIGARRVSIAAGYYRPDWIARSLALIEGAGIEILWCGDLISQGLVADEDTRNKIEERTRWDYPDELVREACVEAARRAPEADAVLQIGAGMRPILQAATIEAETKMPLVSTDIALSWSILRTLGGKARADTGQLLQSL